MTLSEFEFYEQEVVDFVNYLLDKVKDKNFSEYVLLLSRASYQVENEKNVFVSLCDSIQFRNNAGYVKTAVPSYVSQSIYCIVE